jgi:hypothetical protein
MTTISDRQPGCEVNSAIPADGTPPAPTHENDRMDLRKLVGHWLAQGMNRNEVFKQLFAENERRGRPVPDADVLALIPAHDPPPTPKSPSNPDPPPTQKSQSAPGPPNNLPAKSATQILRYSRHSGTLKETQGNAQWRRAAS